MRKILARIFVLMMLMTNTFPLIALAEEIKTPAPDMPYEKVLAKSGDWYAEQFSYETGSNLVVGYTGSYDLPAMISEMVFKTKEATASGCFFLVSLSHAFVKAQRDSPA